MILTWPDLTELEPRLIKLEQRIESYKKQCKTKSSLNAAWYGWNLREINYYLELNPVNAMYNKTSEEISEIERNGHIQFQRDLARLIGMKRPRHHYILSSRNAYACAAEHLYGLLMAEPQRATRVRVTKTSESREAR
jgi:hypothetical protein